MSAERIGEPRARFYCGRMLSRRTN